MDDFIMHFFQKPGTYMVYNYYNIHVPSSSMFRKKGIWKKVADEQDKQINEIKVEFTRYLKGNKEMFWFFVFNYNPNLWYFVCKRQKMMHIILFKPIFLHFEKKCKQNMMIEKIK